MLHLPSQQRFLGISGQLMVLFGLAVLMLASVHLANVATLLITIGAGFLIYRWQCQEDDYTPFSFNNPGFCCFCLCLIATFLSLNTSVHRSESLLMSTSLILGLPLYLAVSLMRPAEILSGIKWLLGIIALSLLQMLYLRLNALEQHPAIIIKEAQMSLYVVPNDLSLLLLLFALAVPLLLQTRLPRLAVIGLSGLLVAVLVAYQVGIALIAVGLLLIVAALFMGRYRELMAILLIGGLLFAIADGLAGWPLTAKFIRFATQLDPRLHLWIAAWHMFLDRPLQGFGLHTFGSESLSYLQHVALPDWIATDNRRTPWVHNLFLEILSEQGVMGCAIWLTAFLIVLSSIYRITRSSNLVFQPLRQGIGAALLVFCFISLLELSFKRLWATLVVFLFFGIITAINPIFQAYRED